MKCPFGDPFCPCQDGDVCHYVDHLGSTKAMPPPSRFLHEHQRMTAALKAIRDITGRTYTEKSRTYTALSQIDQLARDGLT